MVRAFLTAHLDAFVWTIQDQVQLREERGTDDER